VYSLDDSLQVILPHLPLDLVSPDVLPAIRQVARSLPPLHWGGFECRLGENKTRIDFHQGITTDDNALTTLENHISSTSLLESSTINAIRRFCARLKLSSSPLHGKVTRIVLEFDNSRLPLDLLTPSLFIGLKKDQSVEQSLDIVETAFELFLHTSARSKLLPNLRLCFNACPDDAYITDIGIMLSRHPEAVRINVSGLSPTQLQSYLADIRWEGSTNDLETTFTYLLGLVDRVVLCLDIGVQIYPQIGLECFFDRSPGKEPRWAAFLDNLAARGLCAPAKRDALLSWPGYTNPTTSKAPWPGDLILASMLQTSDTFSLLARKLSHIKINYQLDHLSEAKGYIGFQHIWTELRDQKVLCQQSKKMGFDES
jgi:hypothetical protein